MGQGVPSIFLDDAVQEMRLALWRKAASSTWPNVIAREACIDFLRQFVRDARTSQPEEITFSDLMAILDGVYWTYTGGAIDDRLNLRMPAYPSDEMLDAATAFATLPLREQRVLMLRYQGYSGEEIGRLEHCNFTRISQLAKRAQVALKAACNEKSNSTGDPQRALAELASGSI